MTDGKLATLKRQIQSQFSQNIFSTRHNHFNCATDDVRWLCISRRPLRDVATVVFAQLFMRRVERRKWPAAPADGWTEQQVDACLDEQFLEDIDDVQVVLGRRFYVAVLPVDVHHTLRRLLADSASLHRYVALVANDDDRHVSSALRRQDLVARACNALERRLVVDAVHEHERVAGGYGQRAHGGEGVRPGRIEDVQRERCAAVEVVRRSVELLHRRHIGGPEAGVEETRDDAGLADGRRAHHDDPVDGRLAGRRARVGRDRRPGRVQALLTLHAEWWTSTPLQHRHSD